MKKNEQIQGWIEQLRTNPSENIMFCLIDAGEDALPPLVVAWQNEEDPSIRNRLFEVLSEMPRKETIPLFEQKLLSPDQEEVRFAALGLFRFDALRYQTNILNAIQAHPTLSKEKQFVDYIEAGLKAARKRSQ